MQDNIKDVIGSLCTNADLRTDEPMDRHTTFRAGGKAAYFLSVADTESLGGIIACFSAREIPYFIIGNGSNILVGDKGYDGAVIKLEDSFSSISVKGDAVTANAGAAVSEVSAKAAEASLSGLEFASGIPGTVGGAVRMNAGAYDGDMSRIVRSVTVMDTAGRLHVLGNKDMGFGYRTSIICTKPYIVISAELVLTPGSRDKIRERMLELAEKRRSKQPLEYPSAGSTFKRPEGNYAGKLIMEAGLKGYTVGGAQISEKHCGFVINKGGATAADIKKLIEDVQEKVLQTSGVKLEREVIFVGEF